VGASEQQRDADACPNCGARVESQISGPGEELRESTRRRCPNCGKILLRDVGGVWTVDETSS
jgi:DNA-directed RNA polymerase subunit RPC12/RpoP